MGTVRVEHCPDCQQMIGEGMLYEHQSRHCAKRPCGQGLRSAGETPAPQEPTDREGYVAALRGIEDHWILQGGKEQFGPLRHDCTDATINEDNVVAAILTAVRTNMHPWDNVKLRTDLEAVIADRSALEAEHTRLRRALEQAERERDEARTFRDDAMVTSANSMLAQCRKTEALRAALKGILKVLPETTSGSETAAAIIAARAALKGDPTV